MNAKNATLSRMNQDLVKSEKKLDIGQLENIFIRGDIAKMNEMQRIDYVKQVCKSLGLNPLTNPFDYITFQGKIQLYAKKGCTDQLRANYGISVNIVGVEVSDGVMTVTARAKTPEGREDEDIGCVTIKGLQGDMLSNAKMKAFTKAKRRVTLSICGLGMLDDSETDTMPGATKHHIKIEEEVPSESVGPIKPVSDGNPMPMERAEAYKAIMAIYQDFKAVCPDVRAELKKIYGVEETKLLSVDQLNHFLDYMKKYLIENAPVLVK